MQPITEIATNNLTWLPIIESLLIGVLVGAQREAVKPGGNLGVREFVLVAAIGSLCGSLQSGWLTISAVTAIVVFLTMFRFRSKDAEGSGFTTDLSMLAVFCLTYAGSQSDFEHGRTTAIGLAIILTFFLEAKDKLRRFFHETITSVEFSDTLRFLALIFIVYPLLPEGDFGPYSAFNPQRIWMFVILVSSVSFVGYFFDKFLGQSVGLRLTAVLGGIASTTATTTAFSKELREDPENELAYWQAATIANAVQFPRLLAFLSVVSPKMVMEAWGPFLAAGAAGVLLALLIRVPKGTAVETKKQEIELRNPLTLGPALKFGALLAVIIFLNKAAAFEFGDKSLPWTSAIGGLMDVDAIAVSVADLFHSGQVDPALAVASLLLAVLTNAIFKTTVATTTGSQKFGMKMGISFAVMLGSAAAVILLR
jgi:uncharacterized membrane protein (DUF4010 family)